MDSKTQESLLVARAQSGDREALEALFLVLHTLLLGYVVGIVGREQAEDVLQESFLQIYRKIRWLNEPLAFRAWCYRIVTRLAFAHLKRERRWTEQVRDEEFLDSLPAPTAPTHRDELIRRLDDLAGRISPKSRAVLLMHYGEGLSLEEIGIILAIPLGTVKSRLAYGLASLRQLIQPQGA